MWIVLCILFCVYLRLSASICVYLRIILWPSQGLLDALNNSRQVLHIKVTAAQNQEIAFC